jgi:proteic killer suppression protein
MIQSYRDSRTRRFAEGSRVKAFVEIVRKAEMKLDQLDAATKREDLDLPGNRLEVLKGSRTERHDIRIDDQWRIFFEWRNGSKGPTNVQIIGHHEG